MKAYFYCRVAHDDSFSLEQQAAKLRRYAEQAGYTIVGVAAEHGHLLKDDPGRAVVDGRRGGNHAGAARTDDEPPMRAVRLQVPARRDWRPVPPERPAAPRRW